MFKSTILIILCLNCVYCYKQQSTNDYDQPQQQSLPSLPKPKAIIHLPNNVYAHKITDTIKLDHEQLSNYLSSINYLPDTIHKHAQLLAQLNPEDIKQYGQSINSNHLPLISLTVPDKNSNSDYNDAQQVKNNEYLSQQNYVDQPQKGQEYNQPPLQQQEYNASPKKQYIAPSPMKQKNCNQNKQKQSYSKPQADYQTQNNQDYGISNGNNNGGLIENSGYNKNKSPEIEYQQPPMENNYNSGNNNYDSGNSYYSENNGGNSYENQDSQSYSENNNQIYGNSNSNEGNYNSENYENSPFDFNFVQDILNHVMSQLEQLQIDPDSLNAYGKLESNEDNGYESNGDNQQNGYEVHGNGQGIQLLDKPENHEINYGYSIDHGGYTSSSTTSSQATSYGTSNEPAIALDNKILINQNKDQSTVTYRMPTINLELPKKQIEHIMKTISSKKGRYSKPIMINANQFKLPSNLNLGKIKSIAFIKSFKLNGLNQLPTYFNNQLLGSNLNSLNNYKMMPSMSKKEEIKYDGNQVLSAYGYGVSLPSSKLYASSSNKKSIILPLKNRTKRLGNSYSPSLQVASSNIKSSIISALSKKSTAADVSTKDEKTPDVVEKKK